MVISPLNLLLRTTLDASAKLSVGHVSLELTVVLDSFFFNQLCMN